jgi:hypothetical protein
MHNNLEKMVNFYLILNQNPYFLKKNRKEQIIYEKAKH